MALFVASRVAVTQSDLLAEPLANLAQATQAVARGDFSRAGAGHQPRRAGRAHRVVQLDDAAAGRGAARASSRTAPRWRAAKARLENILANLSAGVLVFDHELSLSISNHGAQAILGGELEDVRGPHARRSFAEHGELALAAGAGAEGHRQDAARARRGAAAGYRRRLRAWCSTTSPS